MIELDVRFDTKGITASLDRFVADQTKAIARALNKTAEQARTEAVKNVRAEGYNIKASAIRKSFRIKRATNGNLVVQLIATGERIGLISYGARQTKSGVSVQVKNGRQILRHAFIATTRSGHRAVFERTGLARVKGAKQRIGGKTVRVNLPIKELLGPSIPQSLANDTVEKAIMAKIREKYPKILSHELAFLAAKR